MDQRKDFAVFSICKNEEFFLPKFINHYSKFINKEDIYILDHMSEDGSTKNLEVNVIPVINEVVFDHYWLKAVVESFQRELLKKYKVVIFAECDEFLFSRDGNFRNYLKEFLKSDRELDRAQGMQVVHDFDKEPDLDLERSILQQRDYWTYDTRFSKTLVSKIPCVWDVGFHFTRQPPSIPESDNLILIHMHFCDLKNNINRTIHRTKNCSKIENTSLGIHNKQKDPLVITEDFKKGVSIYLKTATKIPQNIKETLSNL